MKKIKYIIFLISLLLTNQSLLAEDKITWNLNSDKNFIEEVKDLQRNVDAKSTGINQLLYRSAIKLEKDKIYRHVFKAWHYGDANSMQDYGTDYIYFSEESEKLKVVEAGSINLMGELTNFDPSNIHIKNSESYNTFSRSKKILIPYPSLEIGGVSFLQYIIEIDRKSLEGQWSYRFYPKNNFPRNQLNLTINSISENSFNWNSSSDFIKCEKANNSLNCKGQNIPAISSEDSYLWRDELGVLTIGESKDWPEVIKTIKTAFNHSKSNTKGANEILDKLTKDKNLQKDKISAIHDFVINDIRYISDLKDGHFITPHTVAETLSNRYGDCKDKSALLIELLKGIGIEAYPVVVATNRRNPDILKVPSLGYFNHMVACFPFEGKEICIDATDNSTNWSDISSWIQGKVSLNIIDESIPKQIPEKKFLWDMWVVTDNKIITETNKLNEKQTRSYNNEYAAHIRSKVTGKTDKEIDSWMTNYYTENVSTLVKPQIKTEGLKDINSAVIMSSDVDYDMTFDKKNDLTYKETDAWVKFELNSYYVKNKKYKTKFQGTKITSENKFDISNNWKINGLYPELDIEHKYGKMTRSSNLNQSNRDDNKIHLTTTIEIPAQTIPIEEKEEFNKFIDLLKRESSLRVFGSKKPE